MFQTKANLRQKLLSYVLLISIPVFIFITSVIFRIFNIIHIDFSFLFKSFHHLSFMTAWPNSLLLVFTGQIAIAASICVYKARSRLMGLLESIVNAKEFFARKFKFLRFIAEGRLNSVYLAKDIMLERFVSLKTFFLQEFLSEDEQEEFFFKLENALKILIHFVHPGIAKFSKFGRAKNGDFYYSREYINLPSVKDLLHQGHDFTLEQALEIVKQIASILSDANEENIKHGYLNPQDIFVSSNNQVILTDFEVADIITLSKLKWNTLTREEALYLTPEQILTGRTHFTSDIFTLGIIFYLLVTKKFVFMSQTVDDVKNMVCTYTPYSPSYYNRSLPLLADNIILKMLEKDIETRYTSWDTLLIDLEILEKEILDENAILRKIDEKWNKIREEWTEEWESELWIIFKAWLINVMITFSLFILYKPIELLPMLNFGNDPHGFSKDKSVDTLMSNKTFDSKLDNESKREKNMNSKDNPFFSSMGNNMKKLSQNVKKKTLLNFKSLQGWFYPSYDEKGSNYYPFFDNAGENREYKLLYSVPVKSGQIFSGDVNGDYQPEIIAYEYPYINIINGDGNIISKFKLNKEINIAFIEDIDEDKVKDIIVGNKKGPGFISAYDYKGRRKLVLPLPQCNGPVYPISIIKSKSVIAGYKDKILNINIAGKNQEWSYKLAGDLYYNESRNLAAIAVKGIRRKYLIAPDVKDNTEIPVITDKGDLLFKLKMDRKADKPLIGGIWNITTDLNHDGYDEILSFEDHKNIKTTLRLIDLKTEKLLYKYSAELNTDSSSVAIGDMNHDNRDEVILCNGSEVTILNNELQISKGIEIKGKLSAVGYVEGTITPQIFIINDKTINILDRNLVLTKKIETKYRINKVIISDINNDLANEVIVSSDKIYVY